MKENERKEKTQKFSLFDDSKIEQMSLEEIQKRQKELKGDCYKSTLTILVTLLAIIIAIFYEEIYPAPISSSSSPVSDVNDQLEVIQNWSAYSDNPSLEQLFTKQGFNTKNANVQSSNILWLSQEDQLESKHSEKKSQQAFNYYGRSLTSKSELFETLNSFDLKDKYRMIGPRKFMTRIFIIPFGDEENNEDYLELTQYRQYNSSCTFVYGVENRITGRVEQQRIIKGSSKIQKIYQTFKAQYSQSNYVFFLEKMVQSPIQIDNKPVEFNIPVSVIGKNIILTEENAFGKAYTNAEEEDEQEILKSNAQSDNSQNSQKRMQWKAMSYSEIKHILHLGDNLEVIKYIISYCLEAMFHLHFPDHAGRNRYALFIFIFKIDSNDNRLYLTRIEQNPKIKNAPNSAYNKKLMNCYEHLVSHMQNAFKQKIAFNPTHTLRLYTNALSSTLFLNDNLTSLPLIFQSYAPLDYHFRLKKVIVHNFPNFLNFYQYYLGNPNYFPILKLKKSYAQYNQSADIFFSKFIPKFRPYKNAVWGSLSGWKYQTKYTFQKVVDDLALKKTSDQEVEFLRDIDKLSGVWIYKPSSSFGGKGVRLVYNISEAFQDIKNMKSSSKLNVTLNSNEDGFSLLQKYIERPYLIEKKKFDFRMFPMMVSASPLVVIYLNGYVRSTLTDYDLYNPDTSIHLTNLHAQKHHPQFLQLQSKAHITIEEFENNHYLKDFSEEQLEVMYNHIKAVCSFSLESIFQYKQDIKGQFQAFGVDIMIDEDSNVKLIEMNSNPYLINGTALHINFVPKLLKSFLDVSMEIQRQNDVFGSVQNTDFIAEMCPQCDILIDETKDFNYIHYFNQTTGSFNYDNPVYKNLKRAKFN